MRRKRREERCSCALCCLKRKDSAALLLHLGVGWLVGSLICGESRQISGFRILYKSTCFVVQIYRQNELFQR